MSQSQYQRVKKMLEEAGSRGVTNTQFYRAFMPKFHARITEMRKDGVNIVTTFERIGQLLVQIL